MLLAKLVALAIIHQAFFAKSLRPPQTPASVAAALLPNEARR